MVVGTWETGDNVHLGCQDNSTPAEHIFICHTTLIFKYSEIKTSKKNRKASEKQRENRCRSKVGASFAYFKSEPIFEKPGIAVQKARRKAI